jgi:hypothetical protein
MCPSAICGATVASASAQSHGFRGSITSTSSGHVISSCHVEVGGVAVDALQGRVGDLGRSWRWGFV